MGKWVGTLIVVISPPPSLGEACKGLMQAREDAAATAEGEQEVADQLQKE